MKKILETIKLKWAEYLLEILVIVIGILIAFALNNWKESRNNGFESKEIYGDLLLSLKEDSTQLGAIISAQRKSLSVMETIISLNQEQIQDSLTDKEIADLIGDIMGGSQSYFPRNGIFNMIMSENKMHLIKSESIKSNLIHFYDYEYKRYLSVDRLLDHKFFNELQPFLIRYIGIPLDIEMFNANYNELAIQLNSVRGLLSPSCRFLINFQLQVNKLINEITVEYRK